MPDSVELSNASDNPFAPVVLGLKKLVAVEDEVPNDAVPASIASAQPSPSESRSKLLVIPSPSVSSVQVGFGLDEAW